MPASVLLFEAEGRLWPGSPGADAREGVESNFERGGSQKHDSTLHSRAIFCANLKGGHKPRRGTNPPALILKSRDQELC